jgi:hypothetical protein
MHVGQQKNHRGGLSGELAGERGSSWVSWRIWLLTRALARV